MRLTIKRDMRYVMAGVMAGMLSGAVLASGEEACSSKSEHAAG